MPVDYRNQCSALKVEKTSCMIFFFKGKSDLVNPNSVQRKVTIVALLHGKKFNIFEVFFFFFNQKFYFHSELGSFLPLILKMLINKRIHLVLIKIYTVKVTSQLQIQPRTCKKLCVYEK